MIEPLKIAAYTRISVDIELDRDNTSIENQKAIIGDYCKLHFPTSTVDYYEDRDKWNRMICVPNLCEEITIYLLLKI